MLLKEITTYLESMAPLALQESYDNSGLIVGHGNMEITAAMICLDSTPEVIREAKEKGCNLVIAHHPIVFSGLKKFNGKNYIERAVMEAIKHDIAIYAIHTNLDNVSRGVNARIAEKLGLRELSILDTKQGALQKLVVFVPKSHAEMVREAIFAAGGGQIGDYDECSFGLEGTGTFRAGPESKPYVGEKGVRHSEQEVRLEILAPQFKIVEMIKAMHQVHPYEEVAFDVYPVQNQWQEVGSGMIGELEKPMSSMDFLHFLKKTMQTGCVRHTKLIRENVQRIAVCGGSGSFLLGNAISQNADVLVTSDFKYHQFFDAEDQILIADIGHYESEQFTMELLHAWMKQKFPTFASHLTGVVTNPVLYL